MNKKQFLPLTYKYAQVLVLEKYQMLLKPPHFFRISNLGLKVLFFHEAL